MIRVSFQGERGAYSEGAALSFFKEEIETIPLSTFAEALEHTTQNKTDYAVLPVENSIEGSVGENYDLLYSTDLTVIGEIYYKIEHCLIGQGKLEQVNTVYSHPQALGQCRRFLQQNKKKTVPTYDTAGSVKIIKDMNKEDVASIASKNASRIYEIPIIKEKIADNENNFTRFLVLAKEPIQTDNDCKTSIIFSIKHEPGALFRIIEKFHSKEINLTKIESRPKKDTAWEYNFYVDFEGKQSDSNVAEVLENIRKNSLFLKILGTYPISK